jgi:hypothetical protein
MQVIEESDPGEDEEAKAHKKRLLQAWHTIQIEQLRSKKSQDEENYQLLEDIVNAQRDAVINGAKSGEISQVAADELLRRLDMRQELNKSV